MGIFRSKQFVLFLITGGIAALANFGSRFVFNEFTSFEVAVILAYLVGMISAFVLAKLFVFKESSHSTSRSFIWFTLVNLVAVAQTYFISIGLFYYGFAWLGYDFYPAATAHAIGVIFPVFTSFIGHKYLSFKKA
ncbi:MAG: GtrA family protein [Thiomicrospira sp.]